MSDAGGGRRGGPVQARSVSVLTSPWRVRMVLSGPVDASMSDELTAAVREAERPGLPVEVDTRTVTFMDSTVPTTARLSISGRC